MTRAASQSRGRSLESIIDKSWRGIVEPIIFSVEGEPKAQPRPRAFARFIAGKATARVYDAGTAEGWKGLIALAARPYVPETPLEGPIKLDVDFYFSRPKCLMRRKDPDGRMPHCSKPDRDNLEKSAGDCLKTLGMFRDDGQICAGEVRKFYCEKGGISGAVIEISIPLTE